MKLCINCGLKLVEDVRRCEKCLAIQPSVRHRQHRTGTPYLIIGWAVLILVVAVAWGFLGFDTRDLVVFTTVESVFGAGIIVILHQLLFLRP
jgi:predicted nucleic acid-binding Zn ribbon protein